MEKAAKEKASRGGLPPEEAKCFANVVIVSAWGRGAWLAHQLQNKGFKTTVLDVSALLPSISSVEREGPFGVFLPSHLSDLQKQYLCGDNYYPVPQGFSVLTAEGPVEFQGSLNSFFMQTRKDFSLCRSILSHPPFFSEKGDSDFSRRGKAPLSEEFEKFDWLVRLSAELTDTFDSNGFREKKPSRFRKWNSPALSMQDRFYEQTCVDEKQLQSGRPFCRLSPFFTDYVLRECSQRHFEDLKYSLKKEGVEWIDIFSVKKTVNTEKRSLAFKKKYIQLKLYERERHTDFLIWTLSGPETLQCFPEWMSLLFPRWESPVKIWRRFPLSWDQGAFEKIIPALLLVLPEHKRANRLLSLPTQKKKTRQVENGNTEEPILSLKKNPLSVSMDLWMLCPYAERFNESVLSSCLQSALERLRFLFPGFSITGFLPETDSCHDYFVLYKRRNITEKKRKLFHKGTHPRLLHLNPESVGKMDAYSLMRQSEFCLQQIQKIL